jgi:hypothetical protein
MYCSYKAKWEHEKFMYDVKGTDNDLLYGTTSTFAPRDIGNPQKNLSGK